MKLNHDLKAIHDYLLTIEGSDTSKLITKAEEALHGMLILPGTGAKTAFVGDPPLWSANPYGDREYVWALNRLEYMVTLCKAFLVTKERRYLDKVEKDLADWFEKEPPPPIPTDLNSAIHYHGVHSWRMLELGCRMTHSIPVILSVLRTYGNNKKLVDQLLECIEAHAERISSGSHLLWPNRDHNHYSTEVIGMLACAALLPNHPKANAWRDQAIEGLEIACAAQITEDGSQREGAGHYHTVVAISFCYSIHFANRCGGKFSPEFISRVKNSLDFAIHTMTPTGDILAFGDSSPEYSGPITAAVLCYLTFGELRPLITLSRFIDAAHIRDVLQVTCPWGFDRIPEVLDWLKAPSSNNNAELLPLVTYQRQMDQYIARTSWEKDAAILFFSSNSPIDNGSNHAHMDQLGIIFGTNGKMLIQDPGRFSYVDGEVRHYYKRSQSHSLPTVDGRDAFEYISTFRYGPQKDGAITAVMDTDRIKGAYGYHENYSPAILSRSVALIDGKFLLIADTFEHIKGENMKVFFHLNSATSEIDGSSVVTADEGINIRVLPARSDREVMTEVIDGRLSTRSDYEYPTKRAVFSRVAADDTETMVFAAVPFADASGDSMKDFIFDGGIITFNYMGKDYRITYENGIFSF